MADYFNTGLGIFKRLIGASAKVVSLAVFAVQLRARDLIWTVGDLRPAGGVIPPGYPGHGGDWPKYIAPNLESDSRSPCPGLKSLANHAKQIDQGRGWINLHDLNALIVIQHDASFTRHDIAFCPDQSSPDRDLVERLLAHASKGHSLSLADIAYYSGLRRAESKHSNGDYSLAHSFRHKLGSGNGALIFAVFGGDVKDLRVWLGEERFPAGWEPKNREALGYTIVQSQAATLLIEFSIDEEQQLRRGDELSSPGKLHE
ncbi:hypothetical protein BJX68DRAFT_254671 [Aspergillus pseudodeflectus]|uniref:Heme haloperoxidase family profile domain-containing protein n=1 Tax=Aspergillus pseudodeflectus TaxID=176178 RepID=A0ABR4KIK3_9EURO